MIDAVFRVTISEAQTKTAKFILRRDRECDAPPSGGVVTFPFLSGPWRAFVWAGVYGTSFFHAIMNPPQLPCIHCDVLPIGNGADFTEKGKK